MANYTYTLGNITLPTGSSYNTGTVLTTNGHNGTSWASSSVLLNATTTAAKLDKGGVMELTGDNADLIINGQSLSETLKAINARLGILVPNPKLEKEFEELQKLGEQYRELEKKYLAQMKVFDILKDDQ
jgi:hypothetical protein